LVNPGTGRRRGSSSGGSRRSPAAGAGSRRALPAGFAPPGVPLRSPPSSRLSNPPRHPPVPAGMVPPSASRPAHDWPKVPDPARYRGPARRDGRAPANPPVRSRPLSCYNSAARTIPTKGDANEERRSVLVAGCWLALLGCRRRRRSPERNMLEWCPIINTYMATNMGRPTPTRTPSTTCRHGARRAQEHRRLGQQALYRKLRIDPLTT